MADERMNRLSVRDHRRRLPGTTGDLAHLLHLFDASGLECETLDRRDLERDDRTVSYFTYRLTRD